MANHTFSKKYNVNKDVSFGIFVINSIAFSEFIFLNSFFDWSPSGIVSFNFIGPLLKIKSIIIASDIFPSIKNFPVGTLDANPLPITFNLNIFWFINQL